MTLSMVMEHLLGQVEEAIPVILKMEKDME